MDIYIITSEKPQGDDFNVENKEVYEYMEKNNLKEFSFALLLHVYDYSWHNGEGDGYLLKVYDTFDEAREHSRVYPISREDIEYGQMDKAVEIFVKKLPQPNIIRILVDRWDIAVYDLFSPAELSELIPEKYKTTENKKD